MFGYLGDTLLGNFSVFWIFSSFLVSPFRIPDTMKRRKPADDFVKHAMVSIHFLFIIKHLKPTP